jgi:hypothetical protein
LFIRARAYRFPPGAGYGLWVQFYGVVKSGGGALPVIKYNGHLVHLYNLPYAFVTPSQAVLLHTTGTAAQAALYPQPQAEYLAYLGWLLIIVLLAATILFWRHLAVRVTAVTVAVLGLFSFGGQPVAFHYPAAGLPWYWLQNLPALSSALPDRLAILADGAAGAALAFSLDLARSRAPRAGRWRHSATAVTGWRSSRSCRSSRCLTRRPPSRRSRRAGRRPSPACGWPATPATWWFLSLGRDSAAAALAGRHRRAWLDNRRRLHRAQRAGP